MSQQSQIHSMVYYDKYGQFNKYTHNWREFIVKSADGKQSYTLKDNQLQQLSPVITRFKKLKAQLGIIRFCYLSTTLSQDGKWSREVVAY